MRFEDVVENSRLLEFEPHFGFGAPDAVDTAG
jgi:hypothetical protein